MNLPVEASEDEIVAAVRAANEDERVHGILVQVSCRCPKGRKKRTRPGRPDSFSAHGFLAPAVGLFTPLPP